jgi:hypothetical protein
MKASARRIGFAAMVVAARTYQSVGVAGVLGLALCAAAALLFSLAWQQHQRDLADAAKPPAATEVEAPRRQAPARMPLPAASDIPLLLTRMQRAALDSGLGWPRADYRLNAASEEAPASLEVRCALKGPYPGVRRFVTALLQDAPTLTLREFALSRPSADAADVEAKLAIVVYLSSGVPTASPEAAR